MDPNFFVADKAGSSQCVLFFWILERFRSGFAVASKKEETKGRENRCFKGKTGTDGNDLSLYMYIFMNISSSGI